jgi:hypothetical protein
MAYSSIAFIALAAAQAAAPQSEIQQPAHAVQTEPVAQVASPVPAPAAAAQTVAQSAPARTILWRNVESGMSVSQLRSLYPAGAAVSYKDDRTVLTDVPIIEGCQAKVNIMHEAGAVKEIVMRGEGAIAGRCSLKIIAALSGKYGEPLEKDKVKGSLFAREGKNYVWTRDGITLQFKRYTSGALGGGGLFAASWELRYAANATNIDL